MSLDLVSRSRPRLWPKISRPSSRLYTKVSRSRPRPYRKVSRATMNDKKLPSTGIQCNLCITNSWNTSFNMKICEKKTIMRKLNCDCDQSENFSDWSLSRFWGLGLKNSRPRPLLQDQDLDKTLTKDLENKSKTFTNRTRVISRTKTLVLKSQDSTKFGISKITGELCL